MKRAFTLVEMLVVLAIISILAGLLMPAISRARAEGRKTACLSNERQVGLQLAMHANDNQDKYPSWYGNSVAAEQRISGGPYDGLYGFDSSLSIALLYPDYVDQTELFICPATDSSVEIVGRAVGGGALNLDGDASTAEWRFAVRNEGWPYTQDPDYLIDPRVPRKSDPRRAVYGDGPDINAIKRDAANSGWDDNVREFANHGDGANVLSFDGQASFVKFEIGPGHGPFGFTNNKRIEVGQVMVGGRPYYHTCADSDVYADDPSPPAGWRDYYNDGGKSELNADHGGNQREDCDLGNFVYRNEIGSIPNQNLPVYSGPDQDYVGP